jgi:hypothetical protein
MDKFYNGTGDNNILHREYLDRYASVAKKLFP